MLGACVMPAGGCPQSSPSLCLAASLPFVILTLVNSPYKRGFYCNDDSIRYPYKADTITHGLMAGVTITCTVVIVRKCYPLPSGSGTSWHVVSGSWVPAQPTSRPLAGQQDARVEPCSAGGQELPLGQRDPRPGGLVPCREGERPQELPWQAGRQAPGAPLPQT